MVDILSGFFAAWREVLHFSELTSVAVGILAALVALGWFDPASRAFAIRVGLLVILVYGCLIYGLHLGGSDVRAQWNAANVKMAEEEKARDDSAAKATNDQFSPLIAARDKQILDLQTQVSAYEAKISKLPSCPLGADALRLRH
jgi:hypothetical protein